MLPTDLPRRTILAGLALGAAPLAAQQVMKAIADLKPGEYTWHPERSPAGPVAIVVSVPDQRVHVYRNGIRIGVSTCSTGKPGHETPTGVFTILQKDKDHRSSTYNNAPMPNMNRLTWDGVALHAGKLPGYPASHGCVRLPMAFSEKLFGVTHVGTPVIIGGAHSDPVEIVHPGLVLGSQATDEMQAAEAALKGKALPEWTSETPVTSILVSGADSQALLMENGRQVAAGRISLEPDRRLGEARAEFEKRTAGLVDQFNQYEPVPGVKINGRQNLGENIGDLGGLSVAYAAYRKYVDEKQGGKAPVIHGFTGDQRFFMAWAQVWRNLMTDAEARRRTLGDVHSAGEFRTNGIVRNVDAWYEAFGVKPGDKLYLPPESRVRIW